MLPAGITKLWWEMTWGECQLLYDWGLHSGKDSSHSLMGCDTM